MLGLIVTFGGLFLGFCILLILVGIFGSGDSLQDVRAGKIKDNYKKIIKEKDFKKIDITKDIVGISYSTKQYKKITNKMLNEMLFALGTTGAGKTVFFRNLYTRNIVLKKATIIVDGKPDPKNINFLKRVAEQYGVPFYGFNCENNLTYDFLNNGTATEIKDKIIGLKNEQDWNNDYYKTQAETYLQTSIEVLKKIKGIITLDDVIDSFDYQYLVSLLPDDLDEKTKKRLSRIQDTELKDLKGIQNQLTLLANSDMGDFLSSGEGEQFTLLEAIENGGFVYFALPALKYPSFAKVLGKVVVNDLKTALYDKQQDTHVFAFFDEFGVFAGEQVLNLVNQGRGLGLYSAFGTQSIADLSRSAGQDFLETFMGNINTLVIMRVNDNKTTDYLTDWVGSYEDREYQAHLNDSQTGSVKISDKFWIKPKDIQTLNTGDAFIVSKVYGFECDKIKINYIDIN